MTVTIGDLLADLVKHRTEALATSDPAQRQELALSVLQDAMFIVHKLLGEELLTAAAGTVDPSDRPAVLHTVARRLHILGGVFGYMPADAAAPIKVAEEAMAVLRGDAPLLFARVGGRKSNERINRAKAEALIWDAYLKGRGIKAAERREKIATAFGHSQGWETIRRGWQRDVANTIKKATLTYLLNQAEIEGRQGSPRWKMLGDPDWEAALAADGLTFLRVQRENNGNR